MALTSISGSKIEYIFNPNDFEEETYVISIRAKDDKSFDYINITIAIRFEKTFDFMPFVIIGAIVSLAIIGVVVAYIKIPSWIFARRDKIQNNLKKNELKRKKK